MATGYSSKMTHATDRDSRGISMLKDAVNSVPSGMQQRFPNLMGIELARLELERRGETVPAAERTSYAAALQAISERADCCDFAQASIVRILYLYPESKILPAEIREELLGTLQADRYWMDEPGGPGGCYFTENHQILFHSNEYLAAHLLGPESVFGNNGKSGTWHREHAEHMLTRWLDWRMRFSFSEWNSSCYYSEDLAALLNLYDFAPDDVIRRKAGDVISLIMFHILLNSFDGDLGGAQGRVYFRHVINPALQDVRGLQWLYWGHGGAPEQYHFAIGFAVSSSYVVPDVLDAISSDDHLEFENRERHSLTVEDAPRYGVRPDDARDLMFFWGAQMYNHRDVVQSSAEFCPEDYGMYPLIKAYHDYYRIFDSSGQPYDRNPDPTAMEQANVYTYRTRDFMLGAVQQYRYGKAAYQQQVWKASLGGKAVVYTTHPGSPNLTGRPNYWIGDGVLPKGMAYRNIFVGLYHVRPDLAYHPQYPKLFTHAYFPQGHFDDVIERGKWTLGRRGDAYVGLCSLMPTQWQLDDPEVRLPSEWFADCVRPEVADHYDLVARGHNNVWICELGSARTSGSFEEFVAGLVDSDISGDALGMEYVSPSCGSVQFGWNDPFVLNGVPISLADYPRFENAYCRSVFGERKLELRHSTGELALGW